MDGWLNQSVMILILVWIILVIVFLIILMRKFTFGKWTKENPNPYEKDTLGIPRGVIRAILTFSILFVVLILEVHTLKFSMAELKSGQMFIPENRFEQLLTAFQMMIAFYFGGKMVHHITHTERRIAEKRADTSVLEAEQRARAAGAGAFDDKDAQG